MTNILTKKEKLILSKLYKQGPANISTLAKITGINRTSLYPILKKICSKGLVHIHEEEGVTRVEAINKASAQAWLKRKQKQYLAESESLHNWIDAQEEKQETLLTHVRYFEGKEGIANMYHDSWRNNTNKEILALTDYKKAYESMETFFRDDYFVERVQRGVKVKSLVPDSIAARKDLPNAKALLRDVRFIELFENLGIELQVYEDRIALTTFDGPIPSGVVIQNSIIAKAFRDIFYFLWRKSTPANT